MCFCLGSQDSSNCIDKLVKFTESRHRIRTCCNRNFIYSIYDLSLVLIEIKIVQYALSSCSSLNNLVVDMCISDTITGSFTGKLHLLLAR